MRLLSTEPLICYARHMALSDRQALDALSQMPLNDAAELALILGDPPVTVHRALTGLLADGIAGRANHGTAHLPSSRRYYLTGKGIREAAGLLGFETLSDFVRAYPVSRGGWRCSSAGWTRWPQSTVSPQRFPPAQAVSGRRRGRFDATITLRDGRSLGVVRRARPCGGGPSTTG